MWPTLATLLLLANAAPAATEVETWRFRVFLDGRAIGWHEFRLEEVDGLRRLTSRADFDVRFLLIPIYSYHHTAIEAWRGPCLERLEAETDDNGTRFRVRGTRSATAFTVSGEPSVALPPCVMTFAYWNPEFLQESRLLNPQTGRYVPVREAAIGDETIPVRGMPRRARRHRLFAEGGAIDLWYSPEGDWLALASSPDGTRRLEYRLQ